MTSDAADVPVVEIDLGDRARSSRRSILWMRSGFEVNCGEVEMWARLDGAFRPERLAVLAACAGSFDLVDFQVARCSVFAGDPNWPTDGVPAARFAAAYEIRPPPTDSDPGPRRAVVADEENFGSPIVSRVCPCGDDIRLIARLRPGESPAILKIAVLGTALSDAEGYRIYRQEQQALERAWR